MKDFINKVAVITGAASGIGFAIAERCAQEGMKVVLADIDEETLHQAERNIGATGATVLAVLTDVSKADSVENLAKKTIAAFGAVHLFVNNAGVGAGSTILKSSLADWQWVINVNLWGVIHGVRVFVPLMLAQETEGHIVNTASIAGIIDGPGLGIYKVTKHGVLSLSETLHHELAQQDAKVKVSVLCPGFVRTGILNSARIRPDEYQNDPPEEVLHSKKEEAFWAELETSFNVLNVELIVDAVFSAIRKEQLYVLTHPETKEWVQVRMENILDERNPEVVSQLAWPDRAASLRGSLGGKG